MPGARFPRRMGAEQRCVSPRTSLRLVQPLSLERSVIRAFLALLLTATPDRVPVDARRAGCRGRLRTSRIVVSDDTVRLGKKVTVSGAGPGAPSARPPAEDQGERMAGGGLGMTTGVGGGYSFRAPDWRGTHRLRVFAPATLVLGASVSATRLVTVEDALPAARAERRTGPGCPIAVPGGTRARRSPTGSTLAGATAAQRPTSGVRSSRSAGSRASGSTTSAAPGGRSGATGSAITLPARTSSSTGRARRRRPACPAGSRDRWPLGAGPPTVQRLHDARPDRRLPRGTWRQVMTHELGHVLGLGHAHSRRQLMYGVSSSLNERLGAGDLTALGAVGASTVAASLDRTARSRAGTGAGARRRRLITPAALGCSR